eukprot:10580498-Ditylum_brightwellii.AAC.1
MWKAPWMLYPQAKNSSHSTDNVAAVACDKRNSPKPSLDNLDTEVITGTPHRPTQPDGSIDNNEKNKRHKWTWEQKQEIIRCYYLALQQRLSSGMTASKLNSIHYNAMKNQFGADELLCLQFE